MKHLSEYLSFVQSPLTEGANFLGMFNDFIGPDADPDGRGKVAVERYITWARQNLKKNDRIVWFLRWVRVELAGRSKHKNSDAELQKLNKRLGTTYTRNDTVPINNLMSNLAHMLSLPIQAIQNVVWDRQGPEELLDEFKTFEDEWKNTSNQNNIISYREGDEPKAIIKFADGYAWFDLEKAACSDEASAMGHCGNNTYQGRRDGNTILSLRKHVMTSDGESHWYPVLTFIRDDDGDLGEMKGRNNDKPVPRYHPYIIALLKSKYVNGIKGGGYLPENNFSLNDLDDDIKEELLKLKPDLGELHDMYEKEGMSKRVLQRLQNNLPRGLGTGDYEADSKRFKVESYKDFEYFVKYGVYDAIVEKIVEIALGNASFQHPDDSLETEFFTTVHGLPPNWQEKFVTHAGLETGHQPLSYLVEQAAKKLMATRDPWFEIFEHVFHKGDVIKEQAWERLVEYAGSGWTYAASRLYDNIPHKREPLETFVRSDTEVALYVSEADMIAYASASAANDEDSDYGYDITNMSREGDADWATLDDDYMQEQRREAKLIERRKDPWLEKIAKTADVDMVDDYINALLGNSNSGTITDPRQHHLKLESIARLRALAGLPV